MPLSRSLAEIQPSRNLDESNWDIFCHEPVLIPGAAKESFEQKFNSENAR